MLQYRFIWDSLCSSHFCLEVISFFIFLFLRRCVVRRDFFIFIGFLWFGVVGVSFNRFWLLSFEKGCFVWLCCCSCGFGGRKGFGSGLAADIAFDGGQ